MLERGLKALECTEAQLAGARMAVQELHRELLRRGRELQEQDAEIERKRARLRAAAEQEVVNIRAELECDRRSLEERMSQMPQVAARMKGRVKLNIGGLRFETSTDTLQKSDWFGALMSGKFDVQADEDGYLFIDRDGTHFGIILNYLRMGTRALRGLELSEGQRLQVLEETQYYQLNGLAGALVQPPIGSSVTVEVATVDLVEQRVGCELPHACGCTHPPGHCTHLSSGARECCDEYGMVVAACTVQDYAHDADDPRWTVDRHGHRFVVPRGRLKLREAG